MESKISLLVLAVILSVSLASGFDLRFKRAPQDGGIEDLKKSIPGEPGKDYPIYSIDILRKINPGMFGGRSQGGSKPSPAPAPAQQARQAKQGGQDKVDLQGQVAKGQIPGVPGKDYPVNSVEGLKKKNPGSFANLKPAPAHLITPDYPGVGGQNKGKAPGGAPGATPVGAAPLPLGSNSAASGSGPSGGSDYCPGGSEKECVNFCPPEDKVHDACVAACRKRCA